jgi:hypothetical protein
MVSYFQRDDLFIFKGVGKDVGIPSMMIGYEDAELIIKDYLLSDDVDIRESVALKANFEFVFHILFKLTFQSRQVNLLNIKYGCLPIVLNRIRCLTNSDFTMISLRTMSK